MVYYGTLYSNTDVQKSGTVNNLIIEGVILHARALIQFFTSTTRGRSGRDKDALAKDFLKAETVWVTPTIDETHYPNLKKVKDNADKEIAHLSYDRVPAEENKTRWNLTSILEEISVITASYIPLCRDDYKIEKLNRFVTASLELVEEIKRARST